MGGGGGRSVSPFLAPEISWAGVGSVFSLPFYSGCCSFASSELWAGAWLRVEGGLLLLLLLVFVASNVVCTRRRGARRSRRHATTPSCALGNILLSSLARRNRPCTAVGVTGGGTPRGTLGVTMASLGNGFRRGLAITPKRCVVALSSMNGIAVIGSFAIGTDRGIVSLKGLGVTRTAGRLGNVRIITRGPLMGISMSGVRCGVRSSPSSGAGAMVRVLHGMPLMAISNRSGVGMGNDDDFGVRMGNGPGGVVDGGPGSILGDVPTGAVGRVRMVASPKTGCSTRNINNVLGVIAINNKFRNCATAFHTDNDGHNTNTNKCTAVGSKGLAVAKGCGCGCSASPGDCSSDCHRGCSSRSRGCLRSGDSSSCGNDFRCNGLRTDCRVSALHLLATSFNVCNNTGSGGDSKLAAV